jgi:hypothetical protein
MKSFLIYDKYDNKYRDVIDIDEIDIDTLKDIIKKYAEQNHIKEMKVCIEDFYHGKKGVEVFTR